MPGSWPRAHADVRLRGVPPDVSIFVARAHERESGLGQQELFRAAGLLQTFTHAIGAVVLVAASGWGSWMPALLVSGALAAAALRPRRRAAA
jgi:hypothetical protein